MAAGADAGSRQKPSDEQRSRRVRLLRALGAAFHGAVGLAAGAILVLVAGLVLVLTIQAWPSVARFGVGFLSGSAWDGVHGQFGALPAIIGTLLTSALALLIAVPVALGVAIFLSEVAPPRLRRPLSYVMDLSAAVPSVVYGFWAFFVLRPWMRTGLEPALQGLPGGAALFSGIPTGVDILTATLVLAVMILPTIAAVSREALQAVPRSLRESALSLGATRWEATRLAVLGPARSGIIGAIILGLGRAVGETIAVAMIIGNIGILPYSLLAPGQTLAAQIANNFSDVGTGLEQSALVELGLILLVITLSVNALARVMIWGLLRSKKPHAQSRRSLGHRSHLATLAQRIAERSATTHSTTLHRPTWHAEATARLPARSTERRAREVVILAATIACVVLALLPLGSVLLTSAQRGGAAVVQPSFYTQGPPIECNPVAGAVCALGGIGPEIEGTLVLLGIASLLAVPGGLFAGIYLSEYARGARTKFARTVSFLADVLTGVPTILTGVFVYLLFLSYAHDIAHSAYSGGVALGIVMIPIVTRATEEALRSVPRNVREAALALGFPRHRVTVRVVLGSARSAIVTGMLLALSRAAGDTASLLVTAGGSLYFIRSLSEPTAAITPFIFLNFQSSYSNYQTDAWGAALVLLAIMLIISLGARLAIRGRSRGLEAV